VTETVGNPVDVDVPKAHRAIETASGQGFPVRAKCYDGSADMTGESYAELMVGYLPQLHGTIATGGGQGAMPLS
jgi:hypothetical protein